MYEKTIPTTILALRVPNTTYRYLEHAEHFPFRPDALDADTINAWWLAEISFLVYVEDDAFVARTLEAHGFSQTQFFTRDGTRALLAEHPHFTVVAFRGTDIRDQRNLFTDIDFLPTRCAAPGRVHRGFWAALDVVWDDIRVRLAAIGTGRPTFFTGHSLGAALATLAARLSPIGGTLYTFGSPRVGDRAFGEAFAVRAYRYVHHFDVVTLLPPPILYHHVGRPLVVYSHGAVVDDATRIRRLKTRLTTIWRGRFGRLSSWPDAFRDLVGHNTLADHAPIGYAIGLWNSVYRSFAKKASPHP